MAFLSQTPLGEAEQQDGTILRATDLGIRLPKGRGMHRLWSRGHWVFRDVSFSLKRGETIAVLGHNGTGKSTLLRTLAGILEPDEGDVRVARGLSATILAPGAGFDNRLTGRENIFNVALYHGFMPRDVARHIDEIIDFSEIGNWIDQPVGVYSAGMRVRLGFALSIYLRADILMIDETLSAGDARFREKARAAVHDMLESDLSVIVVSHNPETLRGMCDTGLLMDHGRLLSHGPIDDVLDAYEELTSVGADLIANDVTEDADPQHARGSEAEQAMAREADPEEARRREIEWAIAREAELEQARRREAEQAMARARASRAQTERARKMARNVFDEKLDTFEACTRQALAAFEAENGGLPEAIEQLGDAYRAFAQSRADLEHARDADGQMLRGINEARENLAGARRLT